MEAFVGSYVFHCDLSDAQFKQVKAFLDGLGCDYSSAITWKEVPDEEQPVFRFELFFDGKHQSVGLLNGLSDAVSAPAIYRKLLHPFNDELPVPVEVGVDCSFWFTEKGLERFAPAIDAINSVLADKGWEVRGTFLYMHETEFLYQDDMQVALDKEFVDPESFVSFQKAIDLIDLFEREYGSGYEGEAPLASIEQPESVCSRTGDLQKSS